MAKRRSERKKEWTTLCRRIIRSAAVAILSREGAEGLTMGKVAAEADLAKGTLYLYYKNKKELLDSVREESLMPVRQELHAVLEKAGSPVEKIRAFITLHLEYFEKNRDFFRFFLWDKRFASTYFQQSDDMDYRPSVPWVAEVLEDGIRAGAFKPMNAVKVASMLVESDWVVIAHRLQEEAPGPVQEDVEMLTEVFLKGISAKRPVQRKRP